MGCLGERRLRLDRLREHDHAHEQCGSVYFLEPRCFQPIPTATRTRYNRALEYCVQYFGLDYTGAEYRMLEKSILRRRGRLPKIPKVSSAELRAIGRIFNSGGVHGYEMQVIQTLT